MEIKKDEQYIKNLLKSTFSGGAVFEQFEFTPVGGKERADYAVLYPDKFVYFEIKTEYDDFSRVIRQVESMRPLFTHIYVVIPNGAVKEYLSLDFGEIESIRNKRIAGIYTIEQIEEGNTKPLYEDSYGSNFPGISLDALAELMWVDELREYVKNRLPDAFVTERNYSSKGKDKPVKKSISTMSSIDLRTYFKLIYSSLEGFDILTEILTNRHYQYREQRK